MTYSNLIGDRLVAISSEVGYLIHLVDTLPTRTEGDRDKAVSTLHRDLARIEKELNLYETTLLPKYIGNVPYLQQQVFNLKYWIEATSIDLSENSKARVFKALRQNFEIFAKTQLQGFDIVSDSLEA